jgi:hypothetical protein
MRHLVIILPLAVCVLLAMSGSLLLAQSGMDERQQNTEQVGQGYTPERYLSPRLRHLGQERYDVHDLLDPFFDRFPHDPSRWESNQVRRHGKERTNEIPSRRDGLPSLRDRGPQTPNHGAVTNAAGGAASQSLPDSVQEAWVRHYGSLAPSNDWVSARVIDGFGNVYVTGWGKGSGTSNDYATVKYNSSGTELWVARYNGPGNGDDWATALAVDESGNVYVTGESDGSGTSRDYATVKYNSSGTELWVARYNGPGNSDDYATALAIDASGNVYVTGGSEGSGTYSDFATVKYNSSGTEQWVARYNGPGNKYDRATALAVDESGNVYVTGYYLSGDWGKYTTIKYTQITTSIGEIGTNVPDKFVLEQNYPNPFNPTTTIRFSIPQSSYVTLKIYDLLGQEIETLVNENLPAGQYKSEWNAAGYSSGVYFYRLLAGPVSGGQADGFAEVRKLILLK